MLVNGPGSNKHLNNSYKIYCVKCLWFWFWLVFVPYATLVVLYSMDGTLDVWLLPWFVISNSALKIRKLLNPKWMWSCVCPICNMTSCKLMEESVIMGLPVIAYAPPK